MVRARFRRVIVARHHHHRRRRRRRRRRQQRRRRRRRRRRSRMHSRPVKSVRISGPLIYPARVKTPSATRQLRYSFPSWSSSPRSRGAPVCLWHKITRSAGKSNKFVSYNLSPRSPTYRPSSPPPLPPARRSNARLSLFRPVDRLQLLSTLFLSLPLPSSSSSSSFSSSWTTESRLAVYCVKTRANQRNGTLCISQAREGTRCAFLLARSLKTTESRVRPRSGYADSA